MEETYTFCKALKMMKKHGKKMRFIKWDEKIAKELGDEYRYVIFYDTEKKQLQWLNGIVRDVSIGSEEIMGSWVEVKDE